MVGKVGNHSIKRHEVYSLTSGGNTPHAYLGDTLFNWYAKEVELRANANMRHAVFSWKTQVVEAAVFTGIVPYAERANVDWVSKVARVPAVDDNGRVINNSFISHEIVVIP